MSYLPGSPVHSWLGSPTSIINQEHSPADFPGEHSDGGIFSIKSPSPHMTLVCVKLTESHQHSPLELLRWSGPLNRLFHCSCLQNCERMMQHLKLSLCVFVCACVCAHVACLWVRVCTCYMCTLMCVDVCAACVHTACVCACVYVYACVCGCICMCMSVRVCAYMCMLHVHAYIYVHVCMCT